MDVLRDGARPPSSVLTWMTADRTRRFFLFCPPPTREPTRVLLYLNDALLTTALRSPSASAAPRRPPPPPAPLSPAALPLVAGPAAAAAAGAGPVSLQWLALHRALFRLLGLLRHAFSIPIAVEEPIAQEAPTMFPRASEAVTAPLQCWRFMSTFPGDRKLCR